MVKWAIDNLNAWPGLESRTEAEPADIGCEFARDPRAGSLPVLRCKSSGWVVSSTDYFYAKRGIK